MTAHDPYKCKICAPIITRPAYILGTRKATITTGSIALEELEKEFEQA